MICPKNHWTLLERGLDVYSRGLGCPNHQFWDPMILRVDGKSSNLFTLSVFPSPRCHRVQLRELHSSVEDFAFSSCGVVFDSQGSMMIFHLPSYHPWETKMIYIMGINGNYDWTTQQMTFFDDLTHQWLCLGIVIRIALVMFSCVLCYSLVVDKRHSATIDQYSRGNTAFDG